MPHVNPEEKRAYFREYQKRPEVAEKRKKYRQSRPEANLDYSTKYRLKYPERAIYRAAKHRAKTRGIEFNLDFTDIVIPEVCPILGIALKQHYNTGSHGGKPDSMSLDRVDNSKGYVKGNVQVISHLANSMKSTASKEQLLAFAEWAMKTYAD